jgi:hypothetical protein
VEAHPTMLPLHRMAARRTRNKRFTLFMGILLLGWNKFFRSVETFPHYRPFPAECQEVRILNEREEMIFCGGGLWNLHKFPLQFPEVSAIIPLYLILSVFFTGDIWLHMLHGLTKALLKYGFPEGCFLR